ncbi:MAG: sodium-dependent transporter [Gemmatales bacterium]|nr:sodium-dependent transporter [Gemmatales bacterium]MDW8388090.1 sodium-dependent transporter [Gemmatales bacterium]
MAKERWASRVGLVLAMAGNAVGLGNFLRFPAQAAKNGGGAFLIPYIVAFLLLGLPLMWVEWAMGRYGGQRGHHSAPGIFQSMGRSPMWKYFGTIGLWSCLIIASYYLYIESWCLAYALWSILGQFRNIADVNPDYPSEFFEILTGETANHLIAVSPWGMLIFAVCVTINIYILSRGLARGIELVAKVGMPLLILFAAILAIRGLLIDPATDPAAKESPFKGLNFVWNPNFESLADPAVWLAAAGQIFFTLSIGMGSIHCYASYLREKDDVVLTGATTAWTNEFCEIILGGTILIPIATAYLTLDVVQAKTASGSGFGLGFMVFPTLFDRWGWFAPAAGFLWFGLLFFAAITSSLAMGQPVMAFLQQEFGFRRDRSAFAFGLMLLPLALCVATLTSKTFSDEFDYWAGTVMLVVFALGEIILFAWVFGMEKGWEELKSGAEMWVPKAFFYVMKYVTPVFLLAILLAYVFKPAPDWGAYLHQVRQSLGNGEALPAWQWADDGMIGKLLHVDVSREREAALAKNAEARDKVLHNRTLSPEEQAEQLNKLDQQREEIERFWSRLPIWRNIDRLVMIGVYLGLCFLVFTAWSKRRVEGRA